MSVAAAIFKNKRVGGTICLAMAAAVTLTGCNGVADTLRPRENFANGYVVDQQSLDMLPVGSSREQAILALGSPSTTNTIEGKEAFYYISQQRTRVAAFAKPKLIGQRVLAVYFDADSKVERIADYGLQDGKLFDFVTRTTPTGGADASFLISVIRGVSGGRGGAGAGSILDGI
jgi:outer membrane protein assembly factor BamE (lipoprotein component of BamABCDE complex)